jgi:hypothetical protein
MPAPAYYVFTLFVAENNEKARIAYSQLAELCFRYLPGRHIINMADTKPEWADEFLLPPGTEHAPELPASLCNFVEALNAEEHLFLAVQRAR